MRNSLNLRRWVEECGGALDMARRWRKNVLSLLQKDAVEQLRLLRMSKGREFQIVGAATEKLLEPKHVRTRGTNNRLVSDERNVRAGV